MIRTIETITSALILSLVLVTVKGTSADVKLEWQQPERYSDLGTNSYDDASLDTFSKELEPYIIRFADDYLPDGSTLEITFTDVDLAGELEPWRLNNDVRIVRSVYPPKLSFTYRVYDINGNLIDSGERTITDLTFDFNIGQRFFSQDKYFYEKDLIASWIRNDLAISVNKIIRKSRNKA